LETGKRVELQAQEGRVICAGRLQRPSPWLGLKAHFMGLALEADLEVHLADKGYVGLTRVEDGRVNVSGLFHRGHPVAGGQQGLVQAVGDAGLEALAERLQAAQIDPGSLKGVNRFHLGWQMEADEAVRVGDAAAMIPPFTGNGMTMALQGALLALDPLERWAAGECGWERVRSEVRSGYARVFGSRLRWARGLQAILLQPYGRRLCAGLLARNWLSFETLYRKLR
jgi:flavin-dependent dehydrogenase